MIGILSRMMGGGLFFRLRLYHGWGFALWVHSMCNFYCVTVIWSLEIMENARAYIFIHVHSSFSFALNLTPWQSLLILGFLKQDPDLVVDAMSSNSSSQPARPSASSSASSTSSNDQARQRNSGWKCWFYY